MHVRSELVHEKAEHELTQTLSAHSILCSRRGLCARCCQSRQVCNKASSPLTDQEYRSASLAPVFQPFISFYLIGHDYLGRSSADGSFTIATNKLKSAFLDKTWRPMCGSRYCKMGKSQKAIVAGPGLFVEDLYRLARQENVTVVGGVSRTVGATGGA